MFVKISAHNTRAIAARLYQQRHGDTFAQLQRLFALEDGGTAFKRFRQLLTKLDEDGTDMALADVGLRIKHNAIQARSYKRACEASVARSRLGAAARSGDLTSLKAQLADGAAPNVRDERL